MNNSYKMIIDQTIKMAQLSSGFWERWLVHGVDEDDLLTKCPEIKSLNDWISTWIECAEEKKRIALTLENRGFLKEAEYMYRNSSLYYNLAQWIYPESINEKRKWFKECKDIFLYADSLSSVETKYAALQIDQHICVGRIRIPRNIKGCVIIFNPIDSSKEELFTYESDFIEAGYATVSFDGPGQGETYVSGYGKAALEQIKRFADKVIAYTVKLFPKNPIYTFGISSGGAWSVYASCHHKVKKSVAVSPGFPFGTLHFSTYFSGRLYSFIEDDGVPDFNKLTFCNPVYLFHGLQDRMIPEQAMYSLYKKLPNNSQLFEYEGEKHCCNNRLGDIRKNSIQWFEQSIMEREIQYER
ncbi:S9 family peptidase [Alkalihalobacillus sp. BA299]|uniref:alpha/beta hydrolase family protein n=1 Tax=Alkalihalobacillus sp. BA299 TaxID=2815938 RepID=UPI001ADC67E5|nr:alpha/beta hydrolase [Alkalihalobacillus sp. BA299]